MAWMGVRHPHRSILGDPHSTRARQFAATIESGAELVKGPYVAETFTVSVEEDYLVIELAG